ncbi:serine/threonine-protein kinase [Nocardia huaxiensis]|uniref:serine/threonine-protein kinase n=1 Tax=Nocardia huaxiensis TaxID=2755382 RepID=UPI001E2D050A|nr:serine/threonine-protein kinase [Nocardia huaxiensis]UFS94717.1 protein kinase [Nocardia huaxiensis]
MSELRPGEVIAGYVIARRIGAGGAGVVYAARHPRLPRVTAFKVLKRDDYTVDDDAWRRFEREADIAAHFDHPNIVQVYDRGLDADRLWISMQYIDGTDASELKGLAPERALRIGAEIAAALDYAHGKGVLHRDVKPSNILLAAPDNGRPERALLTDFGIARLHDETTALTRTGNISATFAFASPEQVSDQPLGPQSDQYSLACTLFVLLTDQRPFSANNPLGWVHAHTMKPPLRISHVRPDLPAALDPILDRALAKEPQHRYATCVEFLQAAVNAYYGDSAVTPTAQSVIPADWQATTQVTAPLGVSRQSDPSQPSTPAVSWPGNSISGATPPASGPTTSMPGSPIPAVAGPPPVHPDGGRRNPAQPSRFRTRVLVLVAVAALAVAGGVGAAFLLRDKGSAAPQAVPDKFLGTWLATEGKTSYRLVVQQGKPGDTVLASTVDGVLGNGAGFHCEFSAPFTEAPAGGERLLVGQSEIITSTPSNACKANAPTTLNLLEDGRLSRKTDVSGLITYSRAADLAQSWGEHSAIAQAFPSLVGKLAASGRSVGWQGASCLKRDPSPTDAATAQGARRILCNPSDDSGQVRFDFFDFGARPAQSAAAMFFDGTASTTTVTHPDVAGELTILTEPGVNRATQADSDANRILIAITFPDSDFRSRFVLIVRWPGHTVDDLLNTWLAGTPLK